MLRDAIEKYLIAQPKARERVNKDRAVVNVLLSTHINIYMLIQRGEVTKDELVAFVQDYNSMDRAWRKVLEERPELRGSDYESKDELEKEVQRSLGYSV